MNFFLFVTCTLAASTLTINTGANCARVKRIVGGLEAAISPPFDFNNLPDEPASSGDEDENQNQPPVFYPPEDSDIVVVVNEELRSARVTGAKDRNGYISFKGIRYAEPPTGKQRFVRPVLSPLSGEITATQYGSPCIQPTTSNYKVGSEDCLFLNVHTPSTKASELPVLFWIHGGGFKVGSGNQYGPSRLVTKNIIVVTFNYRVGSLGFLGTNSQYLSGNAALFDIRAALEWTQKYIKYFGGSSKKIYLAGQGSGANVAILLGQSSFTSDSIKGVIAMSGSGLTSSSVDYKPTDTFNFVAENSGCTNLETLQAVRCLQNSEVDTILQTDSALQNNRLKDNNFIAAISNLLGAGPIVEGANDGRFLGYFLNDNPLNSLKSNKYPKIPLLIGVTKQETGKLLTSETFGQDVLQKLQDPNFLSKMLPLDLLESNKGLYSNGSVNELLKNLFANGDYLNLISTTVSAALSPILKVIEETTDALFNLPAVTTSVLWQKSGGSPYFYSFEQESTVNPNLHFLDVIPLYSNQVTSAQKVAAHGDDLKYLFDLQTLEGEPIPEAQLRDPKETKSRDIFVNMVAEFVRTGKPKILGLKQDWPAFGNENNYAVIKDQPRIDRKFRYCQLALWGGFVEKLIDQTCNFPNIGMILKSVPNLDELVKNNLLTSTVSSTTDDLLRQVNGLTNLLDLSNNGNQNGGGILRLGGLTSGGKNQQTTSARTPLAHINLKLFSG